MHTIRPCGCKGVRTCLQCELNCKIEKPDLQQKLQNLQAYSFCLLCQRFYPGWHTEKVQQQHSAHLTQAETSLHLPGILVQPNFLTRSEANKVLQCLDSLPWTISQSGRRKQNFGPKTNFKRRKLQNAQFNGFPAVTKFIQERFKSTELLQDFKSIEQCSLEYDPLKGASIDAHIDDCWVWGERVVTVNCVGNAVLSLTLYDTDDANGKLRTKYNLDLLPKYEQQLLLPLAKSDELQKFKGCVLRIPMPSESLIVLYGPARYQFEHAVLREDINERRVCIAYREFTQIYLNGQDKAACEVAKPILVNAQHFWQQQDQEEEQISRT